MSCRSIVLITIWLCTRKFSTVAQHHSVYRILLYIRGRMEVDQFCIAGQSGWCWYTSQHLCIRLMQQHKLLQALCCDMYHHSQRIMVNSSILLSCVTWGMHKKFHHACQIYFVECVSKIEHILSVIHYTIPGAVCFQLTHFLVMIEIIYMLCLIIIIKSEVLTITHCLGLGHETMVCIVCLFVFLCPMWWYTIW